MHKGRALVSVALTAASFALAVAACESETPSNFDDREKDASPTDTGPGFTDPDAAAEEDGKPPASCNPYLPGTYEPAWKAPTANPTACETPELSGYYDACLAPKAPDAGDTCKAWKDEHVGCAACIEPADNTGPVQWWRDRFYYTLNLAGCLALERNEPNEGQCPATYAASIQCQRDSCDGCFDAPNATWPDFQTCQKSAKATACAGFEGKIGNICGTTYNDPDGGAWDCFPHDNDPNKQKDHWVRVEGIFCGAQ
jgi:hypothetical protein